MVVNKNAVVFIVEHTPTLWYVWHLNKITVDSFVRTEIEISWWIEARHYYFHMQLRLNKFYICIDIWIVPLMQFSMTST